MNFIQPSAYIWNKASFFADKSMNSNSSLKLSSEAFDQFIDTVSPSYVRHHSELTLSRSALTHTPDQSFPAYLISLSELIYSLYFRKNFFSRL